MRKTDEVASRSDGAGGEAVGSRGVMVLAVNNFGRVMMLERTWAPVVREDIRRGHPSSTVTGEEPAEELPGQGSSLCKGPVMAAGQCAQALQGEVQSQPLRTHTVL